MKDASTGAVRYLNNARALLRHVRAERNFYLDRKPVREAMGTAYLAVLEAINEALERRGVAKKERPRSVEAYRAALLRHLLTRNGKVCTNSRACTTCSTSLAIAGARSMTARSSGTRSTPRNVSSGRSRSRLPWEL